MEIDELKTMWQAQETKIEESIRFNLHTLDLIQSQHVKSTIQPLLIKNIIVLSFHLLTIIAILVFLAFNISNVPYAVSALVLLGYYALLFANSYKQIMEIKEISKNRDVVSMLSSLAKLKMYILDFIRISVLTIPALLSFPVVVPKAFTDLNINFFNGFDMIRHTNGAWWVAEIIAFAILIPVGIWFHKQVTPYNIHKRWVKKLINSTANKSVGKAIQFLNELEEMKTGLI